MPRLVSKLNSHALFTLSGTAVASVGRPQIVLAQNPWPLVDNVRRSLSGRIKAALQRRVYRRAMKTASVMIFNSEYMRRAYRENAGFKERASEIVYQAVDEQTHLAAAQLRREATRNPNQVLSVSAMAPHKGVETVVQAVDTVRKEHGIPAELVLVGAWPDRHYERRLRKLVGRLGLTGQVEFKGHVPRTELHRYYAESRVFCLMSRCESFGIPAVEAQAFGTPVVSSNCCAIPEVCGSGGVYPDPEDVAGVADKLALLLTDGGTWNALSEAAVENAAKYRWERCSRPLVRILDDFTSLV